MRIVLQSIPVIGILVLVLYLFLRNGMARKQQAQGVLWLQAMRMLITHIQKHRGLSSGVLGGDLSLKPQLEDIQKQVSRDFEHIAAVGEWVKAQQDWLHITQHWARLAGNVYRLEAVRSIDQHNRLIKNILVFVDQIAQVHFLNPNSNSSPASWRDLLMLAEFIGQVRANGVAVASARKDGDSVKVEKFRKELFSVIQDIFTALEEPRCRMGLDEAALEEILNFLNFAEISMEDDTSTVTGREFYQRATLTLDKVYERFDKQLDWISRRLVKAKR